MVLEVQNNSLLFTVYSVYKHVVSLSCEEKSEKIKVALKNGEKMKNEKKGGKKMTERKLKYIYLKK